MFLALVEPFHVKSNRGCYGVFMFMHSIRIAMPKNAHGVSMSIGVICFEV
jgi:hypothetical protein